MGYKLFCYAYYSNSVQHEHEFQHSRLGLCFYSNRFWYGVCHWFLGAAWLVVHNGCFFRDRLVHAFMKQANWYGGDTVIYLLPPGMLSAPHARSCSRLWRCTASGSFGRIARTFGHSCSVLIPSWSWSPMSLVDRFCSWCGMMELSFLICRGKSPCLHLPTLLISCVRDLQPLERQSKTSIIRCT